MDSTSPCSANASVRSPGIIANRRGRISEDLENEEVAGLDEDAEGSELGVVVVPRDDSAVDAVLAAACAGDGAGELELGAGAGEVVDEADGGPAAPFLLVAVVEGVDEVLELGATEVCGPDAEHKADGVHEVGLASTVGTDDGREIEEGADCLSPLVRLEILHLQPVDTPADGPAAVPTGRRRGGRHVFPSAQFPLPYRTELGFSSEKGHSKFTGRKTGAARCHPGPFSARI